MDDNYLTSYETPIPSRLEGREEKRTKRLLALVIWLIIALLFTILLYLVFFKGRVQRPTSGVIKSIFSIYNLRRPYGVSTDSQANIYISDTDNHRMLVFNSSGNFIRRIGEKKGKANLRAPYGSVVDEENKQIFITDFVSRQIFVFTLDGKFKTRFPSNPAAPKYGSDGFAPYDIDIYKKKLYVTSINGIFIFNEKGKLLKRWGSQGVGIGQFNFPNGIAINKENGNIFVTDTLNRRVIAMNDSGKIRWIVGRPDELVRIKKSKEKTGRIASFFQFPRNISIGSDGNLYIVDTFSFNIVIVTQNGKLISYVGDRGVEDGKFNFPGGLDITKDGVIYLADRENNRVQAIKIVNFPKPKFDKERKFKGQLKVLSK